MKPPTDRRGMRPALEKLHALWCRLEDAIAGLAGVAMLAAMLLVTTDALMRHIFSRPLTFQLTLTEDYLLVALVLFAMPWGFRTGGFIRIDELTRRLPLAAASVLLRTGLLVSAAYMMLLAWEAWKRFHEAWMADEVVMGVIDWPVAWSWFPLPVGLGMLSLRLLIEAVRPQTGPNADTPQISAEP